MTERQTQMQWTLVVYVVVCLLVCIDLDTHISMLICLFVHDRYNADYPHTCMLSVQTGYTALTNLPVRDVAQN